MFGTRLKLMIYYRKIDMDETELLLDECGRFESGPLHR